MEGLPFQFVSIERRDELALLTINDPPANTLTYDMVVQLEDAFFELSLDPRIRAVVITGAGDRFFSGGVNIGMLRTSSPHFNSNFLLYASEVFELVDHAPQLVVAAINGHVTGGGLELGLIADRRVAVEGTYNFGFPEVRLGVIPGLGGTQRLSRLAGPHQALELITHGDFISVSRARELGIVDAVFPKESFLSAAIEYTRRELRKLPRSTRATAPAIAWQRPQPSLVKYAREGRIGVITLGQECPETPALQVLWALNQAILKARMDEGTEAIFITHEGARLQLGAESSIDENAWRYSRLVFTRLESFPRLCVLAFSSGLNPLTTELALACDYRIVPPSKSGTETLLTVPAGSPRYARYVQPGELSAHDGRVTYARAMEQRLVRQLDAGEWPQAALHWMGRFVPPRGASKSIGYAKLAVVKGASLPHEAGMLLERHLQEQLFRGYDGPEGMRAYLEKRGPVFKGE
jgi:enoyl-CoA hydratase